MGGAGGVSPPLFWKLWRVTKKKVKKVFSSPPPLWATSQPSSPPHFQSSSMVTVLYQPCASTNNGHRVGWKTQYSDRTFLMRQRQTYLVDQFTILLHFFLYWKGQGLTLGHPGWQSEILPAVLTSHTLTTATYIQNDVWFTNTCTVWRVNQCGLLHVQYVLHDIYLARWWFSNTCTCMKNVKLN